MGPEWFVTHACRALPDHVRSIVLFGSAAAGDFIEGTSSYDVLVVVDRLGVVELDALAPTIREWRKAGNPLPLLFTPLLAGGPPARPAEVHHPGDEPADEHDGQHGERDHGERGVHSGERSKTGARRAVDELALNIEDFLRGGRRGRVA